jgi:putative hemolysin
MHRLPMFTLFSVAVLGMVLSPAALRAQDATPVSDEDAAAYCIASGGTVVERFPYWGTNGIPIRLAGSRLFCEFTGGATAEPPESRIAVALDTLYATEPTLAALAYLTRPPVPEITTGVNPATVYCAHLGGSSEFGGTTGAGGGWVADPNDPTTTVLEVCVFPDGSAIDAWGITYHSRGIVRGMDLTPLLRYQSDNPPLVFPVAAGTPTP